SRVHAQGWRYQKQKRRSWRKLEAWEVTVLLEFAPLMVPLHARPIVEALQGKMNVFVGLELEDRQASVARAGQDIDHCSIRCGKCRNLRVRARCVELGINCGNALENQRLQPALGIHSPQGIVTVRSRIARRRYRLRKLREGRLCLRSKAGLKSG